MEGIEGRISRKKSQRREKLKAIYLSHFKKREGLWFTLL
jgi:hypothetical protein